MRRQVIVSNASQTTYRRRIQKIIAWLKVEYPEHHDKIVFDLTDTQRANTNVYVYYNATQDIRYDMLHHNVIQCFISANKTKANGKHYQYDHLRKYHDAILIRQWRVATWNKHIREERRKHGTI